MDHPSNSKRGGVYLHFKEHLPLIRRNDLSILQECLVTGIIADNEKYFFTYRSPSQNHEELENFSSNVDLLLSNINDNHSTSTCSVRIGDFNAKSSKWCNNNKSKRAYIEYKKGRI